MSGPADILWSKGNFTEQRVEREAIYDGRMLHVRRDTVRLPDGATATREHVEHPGAVAIIGLLDSGELVFERQYRYPLEREFYELPAGKIDPGELPLDSAKRELLEETGYAAHEWHHLGVIHPVISYSNERIEIFLARGLEFRGSKLDDEEFLEVFPLSLEHAVQWIREGHITDAKTISCLFWAEKVLNGSWSTD